jgi:hypothetical protein
VRFPGQRLRLAGTGQLARDTYGSNMGRRFEQIHRSDPRLRYSLIMRFQLQRVSIGKTAMHARLVRRYRQPMAIEPVASAQIHVLCETKSASYDLRYYGSEEFLVPQWWIGISDSSGELTVTAVSPGSGRSPAAVRGWLHRTVPPAVAERLITLALDAVADTSATATAGSAR